jgi:hypothetical protein
MSEPQLGDEGVLRHLRDLLHALGIGVLAPELDVVEPLDQGLVVAPQVLRRLLVLGELEVAQDAQGLVDGED